MNSKDLKRAAELYNRKKAIEQLIIDFEMYNLSVGNVKLSDRIGKEYGNRISHNIKTELKKILEEINKEVEDL